MLTLVNNNDAVQAAITAACVAALYEAAGAVSGEAARNSRVNTGQTKGSFTYRVDEQGLTAVIGSPDENAVWEELGTGQYALGGNGRKGGWWIKVGNGEKEIPLRQAMRYRWAGYRYEKGDASFGKRLRQTQSHGKLAYVFTYGKKPSRALFRAVQARRGVLEQALKHHLKEW